MLSAEAIEEGKRTVKYACTRHNTHLHEHDDCIRMAYEWFDAQVKTKKPTRKFSPIKHLVEKWCGRYVSQSDVEVAAELHPLIKGTYPYYNIKHPFIFPSLNRLLGIGQAKTHHYQTDERNMKASYAKKETDN